MEERVFKGLKPGMRIVVNAQVRNSITTVKGYPFMSSKENNECGWEIETDAGILEKDKVLEVWDGRIFVDTKEKIAKELGEYVFGHQENSLNVYESDLIGQDMEETCKKIENLIDENPMVLFDYLFAELEGFERGYRGDDLYFLYDLMQEIGAHAPKQYEEFMVNYCLWVWMRPRELEDFSNKLAEFASFYQGGGELYEDNSEEERSAYRKGMNRAFEILTGDSLLLRARDLKITY